MNKLALVAAALLALMLLALPPIVGSVTEAHVRERVAAIDASPSVAAEVTAFDGGWFRSRATIELALAPDGIAALPDAAGAPLGAFGLLPIVVDFAHGPIAVLDGVHFGWSKAIAHADSAAPGIADLEQTLGVPYLFEFRSRTSYWGSLDFDADAPPFELPVVEALLMFSGATLAGSFDAPRLVADAQVGSFALVTPTGTFAVSGLQATVDNVLRSQYVLPGESAFSIASISASGPLLGTAPTFEAANLRVRSNVEVDAAGELFDMRVNYDLDSIRFENNELTAGAVELRVRNLNVAAIEAYGALVSDAGSDPDTIVASLGPHLERALQAGPTVALNPVRFRYNDEPFEGRIEITTNPARLPPAGTLSLDNALMLLALLNVNAEVRLSKTLARTLAMQAARLQLAGDASIPPDQLDYMLEAQSGVVLTMLVGQGMLIDDGDNYRSSLDYTDGALTLNGGPLPFGLP